MKEEGRILRLILGLGSWPAYLVEYLWPMAMKTGRGTCCGYASDMWECGYVLVAMCMCLCGCQQTSPNMQQFEYFQLANCLLFIDGPTTREKGMNKRKGKKRGWERQSKRQRKEETNKPAKMTLSDPKCQPSLLCDCQIGSTYNAEAAAAPSSLPPRPLFRLDTTSGSSSSSSGSSHVT